MVCLLKTTFDRGQSNEIFGTTPTVIKNTKANSMGTKTHGFYDRIQPAPLITGSQLTAKVCFFTREFAKTSQTNYCHCFEIVQFAARLFLRFKVWSSPFAIKTKAPQRQWKTTTRDTLAWSLAIARFVVFPRINRLSREYLDFEYQKTI